MWCTREHVRLCPCTCHGSPPVPNDRVPKHFRKEKCCVISVACSLHCRTRSAFYFWHVTVKTEGFSAADGCALQSKLIQSNLILNRKFSLKRVIKAWGVRAVKIFYLSGKTKICRLLHSFRCGKICMESNFDSKPRKCQENTSSYFWTHHR